MLAFGMKEPNEKLHYSRKDICQIITGHLSSAAKEISKALCGS